MKLKSLHIEAFAGLSSVDIDFSGGLNCILGPNEAGKSTIYRAIRTVLSEPVKQNKRNFERRIAPFLPVGGGDTISAGLAFLYADQEYRLERAWGPDPRTRLELPTGSLVTDDEEAQKLIRTMLPATPATVEQVFLAAQSDLADSIERLKGTGDVFSNLSDSLRKSILESAGVSIETFRNSLEQTFESAFGRWDRRQGRPEQGRGIDNRWKSKVGTLLEAWYDRESLGQRIQVLQTGEDEIRIRSDSINVLDVELEDLLEFIERHAPLAKSAARGELLVSNSKNVSDDLVKLRIDYDRWPDLERERNELEKSIADYEASIPALEAKREIARKAESLRVIRNRVARVDQLRAEVKTLKGEPAFKTSVSAKQIAEMRRLDSERRRSEDAIKSGKITLTMKTVDPTTITVQRGTESISEVSLDAGETRTERVDGVARIVHEGFEMLLRSGDDDPAELERSIHENTDALSALFKETGVAGIDAAVAAREAYDRMCVRIEGLEKQIARDLAGDRYEDLVAALGEVSESIEDIEETVKSLAQTRERLTTAKNRRSAVLREIGNLEKRYQDREGLFKNMMQRSKELEELESEVAELPKLPDEFESIAAFTIRYEGAQRRVEAIREEKHRLALEVIEYRTRLPDDSAEELERELGAATRRFTSDLARGEAIFRIIERTSEILEAPDDDLYGEIEHNFSRLLARTTGNRYAGPRGWRAIPGGALRQDGMELEFPLLSAGTKDVFSICLRLAICEYYTREATGFLIMDDPLVDLDPARQKAMAELLGEPSDWLQRLVFTCHPSHAALFENANRIELQA